MIGGHNALQGTSKRRVPTTDRKLTTTMLDVLDAVAEVRSPRKQNVAYPAFTKPCFMWFALTLYTRGVPSTMLTYPPCLSIPTPNERSVLP